MNQFYSWYEKEKEEFEKTIKISLSKFSPETEGIYKNIYTINYLSKRRELKRFFDSDYFRITYSSLLEAFHLALNSYFRGSAYIIRNSLECYFKFSIQIAKKDSYSINDRVFVENKKTFHKLAEEVYPPYFKDLVIGNISRLEKIYSDFSGLSHSLTTSSIQSVLLYFSDVGNNIALKDEILKNLKLYTDYMIQNFLSLLYPSFIKWDKLELEELFTFVFPRKAVKRYLSFI